jgi:hypothetical protein
MLGDKLIEKMDRFVYRAVWGKEDRCIELWEELKPKVLLNYDYPSSLLWGLDIEGRIKAIENETSKGLMRDMC